MRESIKYTVRQLQRASRKVQNKKRNPLKLNIPKRNSERELKNIIEDYYTVQRFVILSLLRIKC